MILSAIAAMAKNRVIGSNGDLPWRIPEDFKFFKTKTSGHIMIMGRKTFESLGGPLPNRLHVVVTRQKDYAPEGAIVFHSVKEAVDYCRTQTAKWGDEVFIAGGGEIYKEMLPITDRIYLTEIDKEFPGDARFPEFSKSEFKEIDRSHRDQPVPFDFVTYERKR
ncbi:MAG: dihydrofolate reductase [Bdellovibrionota bacterium]